MASLAQTGAPAWQQSILNQLSAQGKLNGVNPAYLALIAKEESGFEAKGAGINSSHYGGFFGLRQIGYSGGVLPASVLLSNSQASFSQQAQVASGIFAQGLRASGGNPVQAESYYQTGKLGASTSGTALFAQFYGGKSFTQVNTSPGSAGSGSASSTSGGAASGGSAFTPASTASLGPINLQPVIDAFQSGAIFIVAAVLVLAAAWLMARPKTHINVNYNRGPSNMNQAAPNTTATTPNGPEPGAPGNVIPVDFGGGAASGIPDAAASAVS